MLPSDVCLEDEELRLANHREFAFSHHSTSSRLILEATIELCLWRLPWRLPRLRRSVSVNSRVTLALLRSNMRSRPGFSMRNMNATSVRTT